MDKKATDLTTHEIVLTQGPAAEYLLEAKTEP